MNEFVDIIGYEGYYQINRLGQVKNILRRSGSRVGRILKTSENKNGYFGCVLFRDKKLKNLLIHRLLAIQFIPNPENKPTVDHIDRNRQNNSLENLRWATQTEQLNNTRTCAFVMGISRIELRKRTVKKYNAWKSISNKFRKILLE